MDTLQVVVVVHQDQTPLVVLVDQVVEETVHQQDLLTLEVVEVGEQMQALEDQEFVSLHILDIQIYRLTPCKI
tara:strand:- start:34 stop:252 length:219 start_codon:yes stop_codon:yes gene_type:complete